MTIKVSRFGEILSSRPDGREAALVLLASDLSVQVATVTLDFSDVLVLTPSWLSEFIQTLKGRGVSKVEYLKCDNASVNESIKYANLVSS